MYDAVIFTDVTDTVTIYKAIGAYKIANTLRQQGYSCLVVDHLHAFTLDEIKKVIDNSVSINTLFVGFSTTFFNSTLNSVNSDGSLTYSSILSGVGRRLMLISMTKILITVSLVTVRSVCYQ